MVDDKNAKVRDVGEWELGGRVEAFNFQWEEELLSGMQNVLHTDG